MKGKKPSLAIAIMGKKPEMESKEEGGSIREEAFRSAAKEVMGSLSAGDDESFMEALKRAINIAKGSED